MRFANSAIAASLLGMLIVSVTGAAEPPATSAGLAPKPPETLLQEASDDPVSQELPHGYPLAPRQCHYINPRCYRPHWTVEAGVIALDRGGTRDSSFVVAPSNVVLASEADLDFGYEAGFFCKVIGHTPYAWNVEATHFNVAGWNETSIFGAVPDGSFIPIAAPAISIAGNVGPNSMWYQSELFSTEINARRLFDSWSLLAGFRIVELHEQFAGGLQGPATVAQYSTDTDNCLYGFQLGANVDLWCFHGLSLGSELKTGIFGNSVDHTSLLEEPAGTLVLGPAVDRASHAAFVGEVAMNLDYQITDHFGISFDYRLLWIDGVALAMEQISETDFNNNNGIIVSGNCFYHGANLGLTATW